VQPHWPLGPFGIGQCVVVFHIPIDRTDANGLSIAGERRWRKRGSDSTSLGNWLTEGPAHPWVSTSVRLVRKTPTVRFCIFMSVDSVCGSGPKRWLTQNIYNMEADSGRTIQQNVAINVLAANQITKSAKLILIPFAKQFVCGTALGRLGGFVCRLNPAPVARLHGLTPVATCCHPFGAIAHAGL